MSHYGKGEVSADFERETLQGRLVAEIAKRFEGRV